MNLEVAKKERLIVVIDLLNLSMPREEKVQVCGIQFRFLIHSIGWDFDTACELIKKMDGYADGIAVSGVRSEIRVGKVSFAMNQYRRILRTAKTTPIYTGDHLRNVFANWILSKILKENSGYFAAKKVLCHSAMVSPFISRLLEGGAKIACADAALILGIHKRINSYRQLEMLLKVSKNMLLALNDFKVNPYRPSKSRKVRKWLREWVRDSDIFLTYKGLINQLGTFDVLSGKVVLIDAVDDDLKRRLEEAGVVDIIEIFPRVDVLKPLFGQPFSVLTAVMDQQRRIEQPDSELEDYTLRWIESNGLKPNTVSKGKSLPRRCAFVIHALSQKDLWKIPGIGLLENAPKKVRDVVEKTAAQLPAFHYGQITGVKSAYNGQEVICDLYGLGATPKQLLSMSEDRAYRILTAAMKDGRKRGAMLGGLGAYTKVIGDAGVTVNRQSPIPVTTGNSYSVAATLWAAREMVEKMGMISGEKVGRRLKAKAVVIGATGSIGRVATLLLSLAFHKVVMIATRPDKLLEVRQEVLELSPSVDVKVAVHPEKELSDADLIVTATSASGKSILDIMKVKPGAVICDCSRPLDISAEEASKRADVMVIESGEIDLPGNVKISGDLGLPKPSVYACLAETVLLTLEGRAEPFSLTKELSWKKVKEIYRMGLKHGAKLSAIRNHKGVVTETDIENCRKLAQKHLKEWSSFRPGIRLNRPPKTASQKEDSQIKDV